MRLLLSLGAHVQDRSTYNGTALHYAASNGRLEACALLLQPPHNADPKYVARERERAAVREGGGMRVCVCVQGGEQRDREQASERETQRGSCVLGSGSTDVTNTRN